MNESRTRPPPSTDDPLGLRARDPLESRRDAWPDIEAALARDRQRRRRGVAGLAVAASVLLTVALVQKLPGPASATDPAAETARHEPARTELAGQEVDRLIVLSQQLEQQLRSLRGGVAAMPTEAVVAQAELQDLIAQVDFELSHEPDSVNLWGQRVNLLLDLHQLYRQELRRDGVLVASL